MGKKVKVEYDVDRKQKGNRRKRRKGVNTGKLGIMNVIAFAIVLVAEAIFYYFVTPAINIHKVGFWIWMIISLFALCICFGDYTVVKKDNYDNKIGISDFGKPSIVCGALALLSLVVVIIG